MAFKVVMVLLAMAAVAYTMPPGFGPANNPFSMATNPFIPPWVSSAPWFPQWSACTTIGADCLDCNTRAVCTKVGGITRACTDPTLPYCNLGKCSATPSAECAPAPAPATV